MSDYTPDPAAVEAAALALAAKVTRYGMTVDGETLVGYRGMAEAVIVALVTEGHLVPAAGRDSATWRQRAVEVLDRAATAEAALAEAVALLRRLYTALERSSPADPGHGEITYRLTTMADVRDFLAAHGGPDGECQHCGGTGCQACDARFLEGGPDAE